MSLNFMKSWNGVLCATGSVQVLVAILFHKIKHQFWERSLALSYQSQSGVLHYSLLCTSGQAKGSIASCMAYHFLKIRQRAVINCITQCGDEQSCAKCCRHLSLEQEDRSLLFRGLLIISEQFFSWSFCWNFTCSSLRARGTGSPLVVLLLTCMARVQQDVLSAGTCKAFSLGKARRYLQGNFQLPVQTLKVSFCLSS